jgi:CRP/FNR family cyclic AMP-dependent transcriptional regulator
MSVLVDLFPALQQNPLLKGFSDDGVRIVQSACVTRQLPAGAPVFVERMLGESAFLLLQGEVAVTATRRGRPVALGVLSAPDAFGELSLLHPGPRRVSVHARSAVLLAEIPRRDFLELQRQRPQACAKLLMVLAERFGQTAQAAGPLLDKLVDALVDAQ